MIVLQQGYLKVEVTTAREAQPVSAAKVLIMFADGSTAETVTNASGETTLFSQFAPDRSVSMDPEYDGDVYSTCDVEITAFRFLTTYINGVQIYAGETNILPVSMEPVEIGHGGTNSPIVIEIPPNHLNERTHEADPPPEGGTPRVLDSVVIPENITVHLGRPTATANNVTITFPNYIKNVCCSEIYSTWPENAIRANIYCQISLALNRVFTEWYRSRGYSFDITNSTQYDQYYVHGRNVSENVSRIVDEVFRTYIRKGTNIEPFFAEYCNGTTATCPGLKQWGTVSLANQGYTPLGILRYYYGNEINLTEAGIVKGIPMSYPGTPLRQGSTGDAVRAIQTQLLRIRQNYPLIPNIGSADGVFGAQTTAAVRTFQSIFSMTTDGVVGAATWYRISFIYVAVTKLAELTSEGIQGPAITPPPSIRLQIGDTGEAVTLAQFILNVAADFYDAIQPIPVDGVFGRLTSIATQEFQTQMNITADGIIGPVTWDALYETYYDIMNTVDPVNLQYPGTLLRLGSISSNVSIMQRYLNYIGMFFPSIQTLTIDANFGNATKTAVTTFQGLFGLNPDGIIGPLTWNQIVTTYNILANNI